MGGSNAGMAEAAALSVKNTAAGSTPRFIRCRSILSWISLPPIQEAYQGVGRINKIWH